MKKRLLFLMACTTFFATAPAFCMDPSEEDKKGSSPKPAPSCGRVVLTNPTAKDASIFNLCPLEVKWNVFKNLSARDIESMLCVSQHYFQLLQPAISRVNFDLEANLPGEDEWKEPNNFEISLYLKKYGVPTLLQSFTIFQTTNKSKGNAYFIPLSEKLEFFIKVGPQDGLGVDCLKNWNFSGMSFCPIYIKNNQETTQEDEKYSLKYKLEIQYTPHFSATDSHPHSDLHPHERFLSKCPPVTPFASNCILLWDLEKETTTEELMERHRQDVKNLSYMPVNVLAELFKYSEQTIEDMLKS